MKKKTAKNQFTFTWRAFWLMFAALFFTQSICLAIPILAGYDLNDVINNPAFLMVSTALGWVVVIAAFDFLVCRIQTGKPLHFNMHGVNVGTFFLSVPLFFGMVIIADFVVNQIPTTGDYFGSSHQRFEQIYNLLNSDFIAGFITAALMAPVLEEVVFRGIVLRGLLNKGISPTVAIWISSLLFGIVHGNVWQFVGAALIGFALGLIYYQTKSLLLVITFHVLNNSLSLIMAKFAGDQQLSGFFHLSSYVLLGIGLVMYGVGYYFFTDKFRIIHLDTET